MWSIIFFDEATSKLLGEVEVKPLSVQKRPNRRSYVIAARTPTCWMSTQCSWWSLLTTSLPPCHLPPRSGFSWLTITRQQQQPVGKCSTSKVRSFCLPQVEGCPRGRLISLCFFWKVKYSFLYLMSMCISSTAMALCSDLCSWVIKWMLVSIGNQMNNGYFQV